MPGYARVGQVCPGREGPLFFGDADNGYVLSYAFFLRDPRARGTHRWYSVVFLMADHVHLINSWPFLVDATKTLVTELQTKVVLPAR